MTEPQSKPRIFVLDEDRSAKIDAIAAHLRATLGVGVSRSEALRVLIDRFDVPGWSSKRSKNEEASKVAA
jgi:hypothetical protein